jgi:hypothetical protein
LLRTFASRPHWRCNPALREANASLGELDEFLARVAAPARSVQKRSTA